MNQLETDWKLLTGAIGAFLEVAAFWTGHDPEATAVRARLDPKDPFYANLYEALLSADNDIKLWNSAFDLPAAEITALVSLMENRCCTVHRHTTLRVSS